MTDTIEILYGVQTWEEVWAAVISLYGDSCAYCDKPWETEGKWSRTIDHYHSQHYGKQQHWKYERINGLDNLRPCHKICNSIKANREWVEDGVLAPKPKARSEKVPHNPVCQTCEAGR